MRDYMDRQATPPKRVTSKKRSLRRSQVIRTLTSPHLRKKGALIAQVALYTIRITTSRYFSFCASQDSLRCLNTHVFPLPRSSFLSIRRSQAVQEDFNKTTIEIWSRKPLGGFAACRAIISYRCESRKLFNGVRNQNSKRKLNIILKNIARQNIMMLKCGQPPTNDYMISWTSWNAGEYFDLPWLCLYPYTTAGPIFSSF